ncbi:hypothetical protein [Azospirillum ramasamyi]|uniref:hypothetical protein n=1 Tax=Azospirillum ramasamyi TaxID=682998 RepID=UPI0013A68B78|nr:hypothetical protein [Azospirillum ramasamyi]
MKSFKPVRHALRVLSTHSPGHNHFQLRHHRTSTSKYRAARTCAFIRWREATGIAQSG